MTDVSPPEVGHVRVDFELPDFEAQTEFLESYVYDAVQRLPETDVCDECIFIRADEGAGTDRGRVIVDAYGDPDAIIERERETWAALVDAGIVSSWSRPEYETVAQLTKAFGEDGVLYQERLRYLASAMTAATYDLVDDRPAPVDAFPASDGDPVGWHRVLHLLSNQWGYEIGEEMDAYVENLRMGAKIFGKTQDMAAAESFVADVEAELDAALDELDAAGTAGEGIPGGDDEPDD